MKVFGTRMMSNYQNLLNQSVIVCFPEKATPYLVMFCKAVSPYGYPVWRTTNRQDATEAQIVGLHSAFILPVRSRGKVIAILECFSNRDQIQNRNLIAMLSAVGNQIGIFLERKQLEEALANRVNQLRLLAQAGIALTTTLRL